MAHALLILDEGNGEFRQYRSISMLCTQLSQMAGVSLGGGTYKLGFLVPFQEVGPDLFDVVELERWFEDNLRGPDFPRNTDDSISKRSAAGWWSIDRDVQKAWRIKAAAELRKIIGHIID
jgi:hypothetical protein